jgi:thymidylate synthase
MTTKHVSLRLIVEEMLWMLRGQTNSKILEEKHVNIWKGNSTKEYLCKQGLDYDEGELGPIYGFQWRNFNGKYPMNKDKLSEASTGLEGGIDQLKEVIKQLINDPFSRRIIMSAWNPCQLSQMALPPCHLMVIFSVSKQANKPNNKLLLSTHVIMRSNDMFLGHPYNAAFYAILTHLIAKLVDMQPNQLQFSITDAHLYENQLSAVRSQLELVPYRFPKFNLDLSRYSLKDIGNLDAEYTELDKIINSLDAKDFTVDKKYKGLVITVPMIA